MADLADRVLPLAIPPFLASMGQRPDALVALAVTLCELWPGERLGRGRLAPPPPPPPPPLAAARAGHGQARGCGGDGGWCAGETAHVQEAARRLHQ